MKKIPAPRKEWGIATAAEAFARENPPPDPNHSIGFDRFHAATTGKTWRVPFVRYQAQAFTIDYTLVKDSPHWRIRFTGRSRGRAPTAQKLALLQFLNTATLPTPPSGRLTFWSPCPNLFLAKTHPYVRKFLKSLS